MPDKLDNFDRKSTDEVHDLGEPYDYLSIMHYGQVNTKTAECYNDCVFSLSVICNVFDYHALLCWLRHSRIRQDTLIHALSHLSSAMFVHWLSYRFADSRFDDNYDSNSNPCLTLMIGSRRVPKPLMIGSSHLVESAKGDVGETGGHPCIVA